MTREKILEAAAYIFSEKGYHAASMQDIARSVNLQKASLYHHVSSKQEILLELLDQALDILIMRIGAVASLKIPPEEKLRSAMYVYLECLLERRELSAVLLFEHRSLNAELKSRHLPRRDRFESIWRGMIREGVNTGIFECDDPALAARALLGVMNWTITWFKVDGVLSVKDIADQYANIFFRGLLKRD
ncbi:MAG: TetR/AcrR family transcriptional regulator [Anaerolineales bacterium]|jgi:AcrR family transcriptional regulator